MKTRDIKARMEEVEEGYEDAREEEFNEQLRDFMEGITVNEDDIQGFIDSFTFPDPYNWCYDKVMNEIEDIADQKLQQRKDER